MCGDIHGVCLDKRKAKGLPQSTLGGRKWIRRKKSSRHKQINKLTNSSHRSGGGVHVIQLKKQGFRCV